MPSLARSVPKPLLIELREAGGHQPGSVFEKSSSTSLFGQVIAVFL